MVQYFSQVQRSSGMSHIEQSTGAGMEPPRKTVPDDGEARQEAHSREAASFILGDSTRSEAIFFSSTFEAPLKDRGKQGERGELAAT
jgi:hypothetical protein